MVRKRASPELRQSCAGENKDWGERGRTRKKGRERLPLTRPHAQSIIGHLKKKKIPHYALGNN